MRGRIKPGVTVGQDHGWIRWGEDETVFEVYPIFFSKRYTAKAPGYGMNDDYGSGCLFVYWEDLIILHEDTEDALCGP